MHEDVGAALPALPDAADLVVFQVDLLLDESLPAEEGLFVVVLFVL